MDNHHFALEISQLGAHDAVERAMRQVYVLLKNEATVKTFGALVAYLGGNDRIELSADGHLHSVQNLTATGLPLSRVVDRALQRLRKTRTAVFNKKTRTWEAL